MAVTARDVHASDDAIATLLRAVLARGIGEAVETAIAPTRGLLEQFLASQRRPLSADTRRDHFAALTLLGGRCPACPPHESELVVTDGQFVGEWDHFLDRNDARAEATWGICKPCHHRRTVDPTYREELRGAFAQYQRVLRSCARQIELFG